MYGTAQPRLIIHGGAGNIRRDTMSPEEHRAYRHALLAIISKANAFMLGKEQSLEKLEHEKGIAKLPSALDTATFAVGLLEEDGLFNAGHGAVFTRDGINELEASVMVSQGFKKRAVGVMGLRRVRSPISLAKKLLEHGDEDLEFHRSAKVGHSQGLDVPSAQGHTQLYGAAAEQLAEQYGLDLVDPAYFFTQRRWDEHIRGLEKEEKGLGFSSWDPSEYLPQGTVGAVAVDSTGMVCVATSTGGLTNKLTGRIGDTPAPGAGFWAEEWVDHSHQKHGGLLEHVKYNAGSIPSALVLSGPVQLFLANCLPDPRAYLRPNPSNQAGWIQTRAIAVSGTGNGDSFLRTNAARTVAAIARWGKETSCSALSQVAGPNGELQKSAGDRWGRTGEGEGGMIGIEYIVVRDSQGFVRQTRSDVLMDFNCGGMLRAWIDERGHAMVKIFEGDEY